MNRNEERGSVTRYRRLASGWGRGSQSPMRGLPALLAILLISGRGARPAMAAGLDVMWTRSAGTTRGPVVAPSPDGQTVASGAEKIQLWRTTDGSLLRTLDPGDDTVSVTFSPDGQSLASGHVHGHGYLWRVGDGQPLRTFDEEAALFAFTPDNQKLAVMGKGLDQVQLFGLTDDTPLYTLDTGSQFTPPSLAISPDGQYLATGAADARLWRVGDGALLYTLQTIPGSGAGAVVFSPDNQLVAAAAQDTVFLWRVADGTLVRTLVRTPASRTLYGVDSIVFSKDGKILVTSSAENAYGKGHGEINFWSVESGQLLQSFDPGASVTNLDLSPDNRLLMYGLRDGSVVVARNPYAPGQ